MSAEDRYRSLLAELEKCADSNERDMILDDLIDLTPRCVFSQDEYLALQARLDLVARGILGDTQGYGVIN
jgi:hypothetical protein